MYDHIAELRAKFNHPDPKKAQHSPHRHTPINYGAKVQYATEAPDSPLLDAAGKIRIQQLIGAIRYYARAVDNKILVALNELGQQQSSTTDDTNTDMLQLLDYLTTYPDDGITYRASGMVLGGHVYAAYLNVSKARSRAGAHIILTEDVPVHAHNGPVLTIANIIRNVMSSAAEAELGGPVLIFKEMIPLRQSLVEMGWPQPATPV